MTIYDPIAEALGLEPIGLIEDIDPNNSEYAEPLSRSEIEPWNKGKPHMQKEDHPLWGKKHDASTIEKIRRKAVGRKHKKSSRIKMAEINKERYLSGQNPNFSMRGKKHTEEAKRKIAASHKNRESFSETARQRQKEKCSKAIKTPDGIFKNGREAAEYYGVTPAAISWRVKNKDGYQFIEEQNGSNR